MEVNFKENGNAFIDGKEYIPVSRLEESIDDAIRYTTRRDFLLKVAFVAAIIISFTIGFVVG